MSDDAALGDGDVQKDGSASLTDGGLGADGSVDGSTLPLTFCQRLDGSIFCDDFDRGGTFDAGWTYQDKGSVVAPGTIALADFFDGGSAPHAMSFKNTSSSPAVAYIPLIPLTADGDSFSLRLRYRSANVAGNVPIVTSVVTASASTVTQLLYVHADGSGICVSDSFPAAESHTIVIHASVVASTVKFDCTADGTALTQGGGGSAPSMVQMQIGPLAGGAATAEFDDIYITRP